MRISDWSSDVCSSDLQSPLLQLLAYNPLWSGEPVGAWPLVNLLALAYLVPAGFALAFARELRADGLRKTAMAAAIYALLLVFAWLTLEVRRAFHGPVLDFGGTGDGRSEEHTSELQSLMRNSYAVICLEKNTQ